jgi:hypothetical protein|mmetsp:Transcript_123471/g.193704  ORF Transcript_123471/g.193704 Transcript_123471/m.193704 type:complete len:261 (+) Transcript_123471:112-894(+)
MLAIFAAWLSLLCISQVRGQRAWGISLRGGVDQDGSSPSVSFGSPLSSATVIAENIYGTALEVKRKGETIASLGSDVIRFPPVVNNGDFAVDTTFVANGVPQWALWNLDTFDTADTGTWSPNDRGFCGSPEDHFLGGHCRFGATVTQRRYTLPPHTRVRVRARVHYIDKWNGEAISLLVHGKPVWSQSHDWCPLFLKWMCEKYGVDTCGRDTPDRLSVKAEAAFAHSSPTLDIAFNSSIPVGTDPCYQSWGVDDVSIEVM